MCHRRAPRTCRHSRILGWTGIAVLAVLALPHTAAAGDGVVEIHNAPFTISQPGSYRLTGNLDLGGASAGTSAITVSADDVTIDLGGFVISGPVTCTGSPVTSCSPLGLGQGIAASTASNVVVRNGVVRGFANAGVAVSGGSRIEDVHVSQNGSTGIVAGNSLAGGSIVRGCTASSNGIGGISGGPNSLIDGNTARDNKFDGIAGRTDSTIVGNTSRHNGGDGIDVMSGSLVSGNSAYDNTSDGIEASADTVVSGNTARTNTGYGLNGAASTAYGDNVFSDNNLAAADDRQVNSGLQIGSNVCRAAQHTGNRCP